MAGSYARNSVQPMREREENKLADRDQPPPAFQEVEHVFAALVDEQRGRGGHHDHEDAQGRRDARSDVSNAKYPGGVPDDQDAERLAESVAAVLELGEQEKGQRERRQPDDLDGCQPYNYGGHAQDIIRALSSAGRPPSTTLRAGFDKFRPGLRLRSGSVRALTAQLPELILELR